MNRFGTSTLKFPLYDPRSARESRVRFRRESVPLLSLANSVQVKSGREASRGYVLLKRRDYDRINKYSTDLRLEVGDPRSPDNVAELRGLSIIQAQCVTRGLSGDVDAGKDSLYLVELTDGRGLVHNEWYRQPLIEEYNIRAPAYPQTDRGGTFMLSSMNAEATTWTWETMSRHIWQQMGPLGAWPGFPPGFAPLGTPEGFWFSGVPAWEALCGILEHVGLRVACDPTSASPFTIVRPGDNDGNFDLLLDQYDPVLEDDLDWLDVGAGRVPGVVRVLFRRRNNFYGSEETVSRDSTQWSTGSIYQVQVTSPSPHDASTGVHYLWSDFTVRFDDNGLVNVDDAAFANNLATERVDDYFAHTYSSTLGYMSKTYAGSLPFKTGSQVDEVTYYQDYRFDDGAWRTKITRGRRQ